MRSRLAGRLVRLGAVGLVAYGLVSSGELVAQVTTAVCQGRVLDDSGAPLAGAFVSARNVATGLTRTTVSGRAGGYRLAVLPAGPYEVRAEATGFAIQVRSGVTLHIGQEAGLDFTLRVAVAGEKLEVAADAPVIETTKTSLGRTVTRQKLDDLPISGRGFVNLAFLSPGILQSAAESTPLAASGGNGANNTFLFDGVSADDNTVSATRGDFSLDAIQEFQVLSGQFPAEYGQASGAIINVLSRSGANDFQGRAFAYYRADELSANSPFARVDPATGEKAKTPFTQANLGGLVSGPLKKDRSFFFLSYEHLLRDDTAVVTVPLSVLEGLNLPTQTTYDRTTRRPRLLAKLDHHLSPRHSLALRYRLDRFAASNGGIGGRIVAERGADRLLEQQDLVLTHNWSVSSRALNELRVQLARTRDEIVPYCDGCPDIIRPSVNLGKPFNFPQGRTEKRLQLVEAFTLSVPSGAGDHYLKGGFDLSFIDLPGHINLYHDGFFQFGTDRPFVAADPSTYPTLYQQGFGDPNGRLGNAIVSAFVQDDWRVSPRLTLRLGVRYDTDSTNGLHHDRDNVAPRLHAAWDLMGDGKTALRGGYGRYYDQVFLNIPVAADFLGGRITVRQIQNPGYPDPTTGGITLAARPPSIWVNDPALEIPYADTVSLGVQRQLFADLALSVDAVRAWGRDLFRVTDYNYSVNGSPRPDPAYAQKRVYESRGRSDYKALLVNVEKRFSRGWGLDFAYTLADTRKDTEASGFSPVDVRFPQAEYAPSDADTRHTLAAGLYVEAFSGLKLGLAGRYRSAAPYTITTGRDDNRDLTFNDRPPGVARNSVRGSEAWTVDARLAKVFRIGKARLEAIVEAFNLLNHPSLGFYDGRMNSATFGKPTTTVFDPRQVQLGLRVDF